MIKDPIISYFNNVAHVKNGMSLTFSEFLDKVKEGYWQDAVLKYRNDMTAANKKALPYVTISGLFKERNTESITTHSGYIAIDIDGIKNLNDVRAQLCCDPNFYAVFVSCGGAGLCAIAQIEPKLHLESFNYLSKYLYEKYGIIEVDEKCKDISRARFVSYDPDLFINKDAIQIKVKPYQKKKYEQKSYVFVESEFSNIVKSIVAEGKDVTEDYGDWINIGFALAGKFGEDGRDYFHAISAINPTYNQLKCDKKYTHLLQTKREPTISIDLIYNLAKKQNIEVKAIDEKNIVNQIKGFISKNYKMSRNEISRNIEINKTPISDIDLNSIFVNCKTFIDKSTKDLVRSVIFSEFTPSYNPFHEFLKDHQHRKPTGNIDKLIKSITTDTLNHGLFITKWLCSLMASINGKHSPLVLVLIGGQNTGKTEWFRRLLPDKLKAYYAEDKLDQGKDSDILMTKKLIIMDDEMGGKSKAESKMLNRLTSSQTFSIREPYGIVSVDLNRLAMLCGTTNLEGVLNDPTGNRRILPIRVLSIDFELYNSINKDDLFYEIYHRYNNDQNGYLLTGDEIKTLNSSTSEFEAVSPEQDMILKYFRVPGDFEPFRYVTTTEIMSVVKMGSQVTLSLVMIGLRMKKLGFNKVSTRIDGTPTGVWAVVDFQNLTTNLTTENNASTPF
jgi:predicted P-loop ATPase